MQVHVAVIEDDKTVRDTVIDWLEAEAARRGDSMECAQFVTAKDFLEKKNERFDVVLTDMVMETPKAGLDICRQLREKSPVVIVLTAQPDYAVCVAAMRLGAWDYILKTKEDPTTAFRAIYDSIVEAYSERSKAILKQRGNIDAVWTQENLDSLIAKHGGEFVAIIDQKVVDSDEDFHALVERIRNRYPYTVATFHSLPTMPGANQK